MTEREHLIDAITAVYGIDPHLGQPHPRTVEAIADAVLLMCEVSKRRPVAYANEPWLKRDPTEDVDHAALHIDEAMSAICSNGQGWLDNDGLPHAAHAMLRLAFAMVRHGEESGK